MKAYPRKLKTSGKTQKQIISGLTARNLELFLDNQQLVIELALAKHKRVLIKCQ